MPKRPIKKFLFTLPVDLVQFLDSCAGAVGQDRSGFLTIILDGFYDEIASFAKGYGTRIREQMQITELKNKEREKKT